MFSTLLLLVFCQLGDPSLSRASFVLERSGLQLSPESQAILVADAAGEDTTPVVFDLSYDQPFGADMRIRATLLGEGLAQPYEVDVPATDAAISLPRSLFSQEGIYRLTQVRLERNGQVHGSRREIGVKTK